MKSRILLVMVLMVLGLGCWAQVGDTLKKKNPVEWGSSFKREFVLVQEFRKGGLSMPLIVQIQAVENLITGKKYYYARFEGYALQNGIRVALLKEEELDEAIVFSKNLSTYVQQTKIPYDTEYHYYSGDYEFEVGAYWNPKNIKWNFFIKIDPIGLSSANYYYDTSFISQFHQVLLSCKTTIENMKAGKL